MELGFAADFGVDVSEVAVDATDNGRVVDILTFRFDYFIRALNRSIKAS